VSDGAFELVVVCTANRFRSPIAAALLRRLTADLPVDVSSFGTLDLEPGPVLAEALELAPGLGIALDDHRSRCVRGTSLGSADLVLGFERIHVAVAVVDAGAPRERAFLLPELVALLDRLPPTGDPGLVERARARVRMAHERRAGDRPQELTDPAGGPKRGYATSAREIDRLCRELVPRLFA
jgi:protein-tyrosine phosphatase